MIIDGFLFVFLASDQSQQTLDFLKLYASLTSSIIKKSNDSTELGCCNSFFSSKFVMMENFPCRITDAIEFESLFFML